MIALILSFKNRLVCQRQRHKTRSQPRKWVLKYFIQTMEAFFFKKDDFFSSKVIIWHSAKATHCGQFCWQFCKLVGMILACQGSRFSSSQDDAAKVHCWCCAHLTPGKSVSSWHWLVIGGPGGPRDEADPGGSFPQCPNIHFSPSHLGTTNNKPLYEHLFSIDNFQ